VSAQQRAIARAACLLLAGCTSLVLGACDDLIAPPLRSRASAAEPSASRPTGTALAATSSTATAVAADPNAAPAELRVVDGAQLRAEIAASARKATLVNVWASWCGSCKREIPMLLEVARGLAGEGVNLVLVSADEPSSRAKAVELLREHGAELPSRALGGGVDAFRRAIDPRWQGAIPATFLLDGSAKVRYFWNGPVLETEISPIVQGLLAGEAIDGMSDYAAH
jgi:thiol-disulfide isomerase/thioredoxin